MILKAWTRTSVFQERCELLRKNSRKMPKSLVTAPYTTLFRSNNTRLPTADTAWRRDRHDIMAEILETARNGLIKTHIMYKAKLSYAQLNEYLPILLERGFLETHTIIRNRKAKTVLKTSELGEDFIRTLKTLNV